MNEKSKEEKEMVLAVPRKEKPKLTQEDERRFMDKKRAKDLHMLQFKKKMQNREK
ncbi:hypothetical protein [Bacillus sp. AFS098217]|uniref:hypothetical protein n=1 Tax=Bacillus sp. AFS098217 TaxID=2033868 RepID=UPI0015CF1829|nr:hypothetical protein [Bacillus sp. AFS098217]